MRTKPGRASSTASRYEPVSSPTMAGTLGRSGSTGGEIPDRAGRNAEQRVVQPRDELGARAVRDHFHERAANRVPRLAAPPLPVRECPQASEQRGAILSGAPEQERGTYRGSPDAVRTAEERR